MSSEVDFRIAPEPSPEDREAILRAVRDVLSREAEQARPATWRLAGWLGQRVGINDIARWVPTDRRWPLSARTPWGGRVFPGLNGRGDAK
ncbi:MAG: hypothetical protein WD646_11920 [Actinomycetota bacterium]